MAKTTEAKQKIKEIILNNLKNAIENGYNKETFLEAVKEALKIEDEDQDVNLRRIFTVAGILSLNTAEKIEAAANAEIFSKILDWVADKIHNLAVVLRNKPIISKAAKFVCEKTESAHDRHSFRSKIEEVSNNKGIQALGAE